MSKSSQTPLDVLLIDPPWYRFFGQQYSHRPIGLCYLSSVLEKNGIKAGVYNADLHRGAHPIDAISTTRNFALYLNRADNLEDPLWQDVEQTIKKCQPQIIGISILTAKYRSALALARLIKRVDAGIKIVAGGIHPTSLPEQTLKNEQIDFVVKGEGENTFLELVQALKQKKSLKNIKGIIYKSNNELIHNPPRDLIQNLDSIPHPANHLIINKNYMLADDFSRLFATRGCPYNCIFCASEQIWTKMVRYRSPENIIEEIKEIKNRHQPSYFHFEDDCFSINEAFVTQICELMLRKNLKINWGCETRVNLITEKLIKKMYRAGCIKIVLGAESGSETTLKKIKKGITLTQIKNAVTICKKNRLETAVFFMIGFPWETEKEVNETVDFMEELNPQFAVYSIATAYPGTELFQLYQQQGLIPEQIDWGKFFHQSPEMFLTRNLSRIKVKQIIAQTEARFVKHNRKKQRRKLLNPYKLFLELKEHYKSPKDLLTRVRYVIKP